LRVAVQLPLVLRPCRVASQLRITAKAGRSQESQKGAAACKTAELPDDPFYLTAYLKTAETVDYVTVARSRSALAYSGTRHCRRSPAL
jgi:hypothetical protein